MPRPNAILASLSAGDTAALRPHLRPVQLRQKTVLYEAGDPVKPVYFPTSVVVSLVVTLATGETTEAAMVGNDGAIGMASALDVKIAMSQGIVQLSGDAMVCDPVAFRGAALQSETLLATVMRHEQALFAQAQQSTACMATMKSRRTFAGGCCAPAICPAATICRSPRNFSGQCLAYGEPA